MQAQLFTVNVSYLPDEIRTRRRAAQLYERAVWDARWNQIRSRFTRRKCELLCLRTAALSHASGKRQVQMEMKEVPLDEIRGSEGRCNDFDSDFRPLQEHTSERWIRVATAIESGVQLPPVELIRVGEAYFVRDGHHRVSVAKALGQSHITARVSHLAIA